MGRPARLRFIVMGAALPMIVATACSGGASAGSSTPRVLTLISNVNPSGVGPVTVSGVYTDRGHSFVADKTGKANKNGDYQEVVLTRGTFLLGLHALDKVKPNGGLDKATCELTLTFSASLPILLGTGAYAGISGTLGGQAVLRDRESRSTSGPEQGQCGVAAQGPSHAFSATLIAHGTRTYSSATHSAENPTSGLGALDPLDPVSN